MHEFIHAWGFHHEHTRPDRDKYVKVHRENVQDGKWINFEKQEQSCTFGVPYDGNSIMHYSSKAWLKWYLPEGSMTIESLVKFDNKVFLSKYVPFLADFGSMSIFRLIFHQKTLGQKKCLNVTY